MNVLIMYPKFYVFGGAEIVIVRLCNYLFGLGFRTAILTTRSMPEIERQLTGTEVIVIPNRREKTARYHADVVRGEIEAMDEGIRLYGKGFDVLNPHNFPTEISAMRSKIPSVWMCNEPELHLTIHGTQLKMALPGERRYFKLLYHYEKLLLKYRINRSVVSDQFNADRFKKIFRTAPCIVNYGIEFEYFCKEIVLNTDEIDRYKEKFVILHVGMITPLKNQMASLKAFATLKDQVPSACLLFAGSVGDENYESELKRFIIDNGLDDHVQFVGHVDREYLRRLYAIAQVMLHPVNSQGGWLSPFEMLSAGKPVVVSPDLTASTIIRNEKIGVVTDDYSGVLLDIYRNYSQYQNMALCGREFVRNNLTWNNYCESMVKQFEAVLPRRYKKKHSD